MSDFAFEDMDRSTSDVESLKSQLRELEEIVHAIKEGIVDAFVVGENESERVFTLAGTDHPYRILVESMHEGAVALHEDGRVIYANPSLGHMLEMPVSAIVGNPFSRFVASKDADRFAQLLTRQDGDRAEISLRASDGREFPAYLSLRRADLGNVQGMSLVVTDLSQQKKHEEIVASERLARAILLNAAEAIVVCDDSGRVTHASRSAETLCGMPMVGEHLDEVLPLFDVDGRVESDTLLGTEQSITGREVFFACPNGREVTLLLSTSPVVDGGRVPGTVFVLTDYTERKRVEQTLREMNEVLEDRIARRTADLERRNRELQSFAFVASHDLQEPLRKIQTFASLFRVERQGQLDEQSLYYLGRIENAAARMSQLLADVLAFSRVTTRQMPFEPVSLEEIAQDALSDLDLFIADTGATVEVEASAVVDGDRSQLRQLLNHLIQNAVKFRRDDVPAKVRVTAHVEADGNGAPPFDALGPSEVCRIVVEDNGIGFQPHFTDRIFEPLQRLHPRDRYPGTGMGLSICRRIVERHSGLISAQSTPGEGSRFEVVLPVAQGA